MKYVLASNQAALWATADMVRCPSFCKIIVNSAKKLHETPSGIQKRHDLIKTLAAFEIGIHDDICVDNLFTGSKDNIRHLLGNPYSENRFRHMRTAHGSPSQ